MNIQGFTYRVLEAIKVSNDESIKVSVSIIHKMLLHDDIKLLNMLLQPPFHK